MTRNCFAYGTLMHPPVMAAACGHRAHGVPAALPGFARHAVRGVHYPGIAPDPQGRVHGLLYRDLTRAALGRLDRFEGAQYVRRSVRVELEGGGTADAEAYVFRPEYADLLLPADWDFEAFLSSALHDFMRGYAGFPRR